MPITVDDNDFPASYDTTLNLVQITKTLAHLVKKITGKTAWTDYPTKNLEELKASIDSINSISRPRILWKTTQAQNFTIGTSTTTLYTITIPAGTCSIDSILKLYVDFQGSNTTNTRTFYVSCNSIMLTTINPAQNTWYPFRKAISFNGSLSQPRTNALGLGGFSSNSGSSINSFADFSQEQTILIRGSASVANESIFIESGYLELI
ncbi:hypothetical protein [Nostoc sp. PCC 7107]|uniref:hypothetical protein n=1 Tax=Nostoc sp. PCC 7107 TaxID=317936 RepID=UPI00029F1F3F|nr:hypothetical protein [Nostoc sp. PCC 7107]AFY43756.1 hypothetical protein Nos7107_3166 [Nostoc sp. PCC 7107]